MEAASPSTTPQLFSDGQSTDMRDVLSFLHAERHINAWMMARANDNDVKKLQVTSDNDVKKLQVTSDNDVKKLHVTSDNDVKKLQVTSGNQMGQANTASGNQMGQANTASGNQRLQAAQEHRQAGVKEASQMVDFAFASHGQQSATDKLDRALGQAECDALAAHVSTYGPPLSQQVAEELRARVALLSEEIQLQDVSGLLSEIADSAHIDSKHQECAESQIRLMQAMLWPISHRKYGMITKYVDRREAPAFAAFASHAHQLVSNEELLHDSGPLDDAVTSSVVKIQAWWRGYAAMARVERIIQSLEPDVEEPWCPYPMANPVTICTGTPNQSGMSTSPTPTVPSTLPCKAYEQCI